MHGDDEKGLWKMILECGTSKGSRRILGAQEDSYKGKP